MVNFPHKENKVKMAFKFQTALPEGFDEQTQMAIYETPTGDVSVILAHPEYTPKVLNFETKQWDELDDPS